MKSQNSISHKRQILVTVVEFAKKKEAKQLFILNRFLQQVSSGEAYCFTELQLREVEKKRSEKT